MIVASGFVETEGLGSVEGVVNELKLRGLEVNEIVQVKVVFLIERDTVSSVKKELDSLRDINGVKTVHLAYYSLEGSDEGPEIETEQA